VHEATTKKNTPTKQQPYQPRKPQTRGRERENVPPRHDFVVEFEKCVFGVEAGKFLGFLLTERGIEANPD